MEVEALHVFIAISWVLFLVYVAMGVKIDRENARRRLASRCRLQAWRRLAWRRLACE